MVNLATSSRSEHSRPKGDHVRAVWSTTCLDGAGEMHGRRPELKDQAAPSQAMGVSTSVRDKLVDM